MTHPKAQTRGVTRTTQYAYKKITKTSYKTEIIQHVSLKQRWENWFLEGETTWLVGDEISRVDFTMFIDDKDFRAASYAADAIITLIFKH